jgi:hypothetical protein
MLLKLTRPSVALTVSAKARIPPPDVPPHMLCRNRSQPFEILEQESLDLVFLDRWARSMLPLTKRIPSKKVSSAERGRRAQMTSLIVLTLLAGGLAVLCCVAWRNNFPK